jgi:endonuclease YncB( thermonuclease family)
MKSIIILLFALFTNFIVHSQTQIPKTFQAKVVGIKDGDTFKVLYNNSEITIRLNHIDCPEKNQPYGKKAKWKASDLCFGKMVKIVSNGKKDRYKRLIAEVYYNNININKELIKNGLAWHFKKYSKNTEYANLEIKARKTKVGLWSESNPIAPWNWRKR